MFKLEFESPVNGWLPVSISYQNIQEVFHASSVPFDPIFQLTEILGSAVGGNGGEVWWNLEPAGYYLNIHSEKNEFIVKLEYSENSKNINREVIFEHKAGFNETIVPIWRSLRKFQSYHNKEYAVSEKTLLILTNLVKENKA